METLVVTLFTLFTFSLLYNNAVPLLGKYQELEYFNDLDTTYDLYHIKKFLRNDPSLATIKSSHYKVIMVQLQIKLLVILFLILLELIL